MQSSCNVFCIFFLLFASVKCDINSEINSIWNRVSTRFSRVIDFVFTPVEELGEDAVKFYLFNGSSISDGEYSTNLKNHKGEIFFIIHGYMSGSNFSWYADLTKQLLDKNPDGIVAQVSWEDLSHKLYSISQRYTEHIGFKLAKLILDLELDRGVDPGRFVLIGHSLGAQISGWACRLYTQITGKKLKRIIALDPAQPNFKNVQEHERLTKNDAEVVFVVHTDALFGYHLPCGTIDFYVNGGQLQHFCIHLTDLKEKFYCSHISSYNFFIDAISHPDSYLGKECKTLENCEKGIIVTEGDSVSMGDLNLNKTGLYYVETPDGHGNNI